MQDRQAALQQILDKIKSGSLIPDFRVSSSPQSISAYLVSNRFLIQGIVSADFLGNYWWLSRALINPPPARNIGLGSKMLQLLIQEIKKQPIKKIVVEPGGYDNNPKQQRNFYYKNGFKDSQESITALELNA
jgi:hypothetical protein